MRGSGAMDADEGVAVAAFVVEGQGEGERRPSVALGHGHRPGRQHGGEGLRQRGSEALRLPVPRWGCWWGGGGGGGGGPRRPPSPRAPAPGASTGGRASDSAGARRSACRYGGSRKTRSYWAPSPRAAVRKRRASERRTTPSPP